MFLPVAPLLLAGLSSGFVQSPKLYVDLDLIEAVYPLKHGFQVVVSPNLLQTQLHIEHTPVIYISALPLVSGQPSHTKFDYKLTDHRIPVMGLAEKAWYYICVEFENQHRYERRGNTSTSCKLLRTLDKFGKVDDSTVDNLDAQIDEKSISVTMEVDARFPMKIQAFLENSPLVQTYFVQQPVTLRVLFRNLLSDVNYGRFCVKEEPAERRYSAMGRLINVVINRCYFHNLKTEPNLVNRGADVPKLVVQKEYFSSRKGTQGKLGKLALFDCFLFVVGALLVI